MDHDLTVRIVRLLTAELEREVAENGRLRVHIIEAQALIESGECERASHLLQTANDC